MGPPHVDHADIVPWNACRLGVAFRRSTLGSPRLCQLSYWCTREAPRADRIPGRGAVKGICLGSGLTVPTSHVTNAIAAVDGLLGGEDGERTIEVTRRPGRGPDLIVRPTDPDWGSRPAGRRAVERLRADTRTGDVRTARGRITVRLADEFIAALGKDLEAGSATSLHIGDTPRAGERWVVEFCDPNATKALHVGHLRNLAIGNALASALDAAGADVERQSIVCDIGRNVCEAMAGYATFRIADDPEVVRTKPDHFVGQCYARYVASLDDRTEGDHPDAPIARELAHREDLAQRLMQRWTDGDHEAIQLWKRIRGWALSGQQLTLARLGISIDRLLYESDAFRSLDAILQDGFRRGVFRRGDQGAVVYDTGVPEYPVLPLVRPDGFPTEHLRVLALWYALPPDATADTCLHVLGDEWVISTEHRWQILRRVVGRPPYGRYVRIPHGMVTVAGDVLKSSTGGGVLVDDVLERLAESKRVEPLASRVPAGEDAVRIIALGFFLSGHPPSRPVSFAVETLEQARSSPGWSWADAWTRAAMRAAQASRDADPEPADPAYRDLVLQSQSFPHLVERSVSLLDLSLISRHARHFASRYRAAPGGFRVDRVARTTLRHVLGALGLVDQR